MSLFRVSSARRRSQARFRKAGRKDFWQIRKANRTTDSGENAEISKFGLQLGGGGCLANLSEMTTMEIHNQVSLFFH